VPGVAPGSVTETYAAIRLAADTWRWEGVPILIRVGKSLPATATDVSIKFRRPPYDVFDLGEETVKDGLRFRIYPESAVCLTLVGKKPGAGWQPKTQELAFAEQPGGDMRPYDRLIGAALNGERWLFAAQSTVEAAWRVIDPVLGDVVPVHRYAKGSWGPAEADALLPAGESWHDPEPS
jgi:glucose-6-phosphate 1-dehydrogenase